jgi:hypothetical protein
MSPAGEARNLTAALPAAPAELVRCTRANEMIGLADGALSTLDVATGNIRPLINTGNARVATLVWPDSEARLAASVSSMIVSVREEATESLLRIDLSSPRAEASAFPRASKSATLAGYHPDQNLAVFAAPQDPDGSYLWTGKGGSPNFTRRIALNEHLAGIAGGEPMVIEYRSADGQD